MPPERAPEEDLEAFWAGVDVQTEIARVIGAALAEDHVAEDAAARALCSDLPRTRGVIRAGEAGVVCGGPAALAVFETLDPATREIERRAEGFPVQPGEVVLAIECQPVALLGGERTALNLLGHLSGISTCVREWCALAPDVAVLDTRKTLPGLRRFQKHAVRAGGGSSHRAHLGEFPMVKENHRVLFRRHCLPPGASAAEEIAAIRERVSRRAPGRPLEIEVEDYDSFLACLREEIELILLDNQSPETIAGWIARAGSELPPPWASELEASGGITGETIAGYGRCGVSRISIGALTHSVRALPLSLLLG